MTQTKTNAIKNSPKEHNIKLSKVEELYPGVKLFVFEFGKRFDFAPGQFVMLETKDEKENNVRRSYSISSAPGKKSIELVLNIVPGGKMTQLLDKLKAGDKIKLIGPHGRFGAGIESADKDVTFIAAGTGITPIRGLINHLIRSKFKGKISLLYGFRHEKNFLFREEFEELQDENPNFNVIPAVSKPADAKHWHGHIGRVTDYLQKNLNNLNTNQKFYICGLATMVKETRKILLDCGVKAEQIYIEVW